MQEKQSPPETVEIVERGFQVVGEYIIGGEKGKMVTKKLHQLFKANSSGNTDLSPAFQEFYSSLTSNILGEANIPSLLVARSFPAFILGTHRELYVSERSSEQQRFFSGEVWTTEQLVNGKGGEYALPLRVSEDEKDRLILMAAKNIKNLNAIIVTVAGEAYQLCLSDRILERHNLGVAHTEETYSALSLEEIMTRRNEREAK